MATEIISIVDPDNGAGTDYTSLSAWEAGEQRDLVTADEIAIAKCRSTAGSADTAGVTVSGWTTSATQYIKIWTDPEESYRHDGKWSASKYRIVPTSGSILDIHEDYAVVEGIQFGWSSLSADSAAIRIDYISPTNNLCAIEKCIIDGDGSSYTYSIYTYDTDLNLEVKNNLIYGCKREWFGGIRIDCATAEIHHNTFYNNYYGIRVGSGTVNAIGNVVFGCDDDFNGSFNTLDYNASDDGDGTNPVSPSGSDWANEFTDYTNGDFSILNTGNLYFGSEITQADDSDIPSDDIIGTARNTGSSEQTSIGAFEYAAAGSTYTQSSGFDALIQKTGIAKTLSIDALIQAAKTTSCDLNALIAMVQSGQLSIDALLQMTSGVSVSVDALILAAKSGTISIDAFLKTVFSSSSSLDAILVTAGETMAITSLDALVQAIKIGTASLDALISESYSGSTALDAIVFALGVESVGIDALLYHVGTGELSLDALIQISAGVTVGVDALLYASQTGMVSLDAILGIIGSATSGLDAMLFLAQGAGVGLDAILGALEIVARSVITPPARDRSIAVARRIRTISQPARVKTITPR